MAATKEEIIEALKEMTLLEASELVKMIEEEFGVSAAAPAAVVAAGPAAGAAAEAEEKTEFDVVLEGFEEAVESAPKAIQEGVAKDKAEEIKAKLEEAGAAVTLK